MQIFEGMQGPAGPTFRDVGTYAKKMRKTFWFIAYIPFEIQICTTQILKACILSYPKMIQED